MLYSPVKSDNCWVVAKTKNLSEMKIREGHLYCPLCANQCWDVQSGRPPQIECQGSVQAVECCQNLCPGVAMSAKMSEGTTTRPGMIREPTPQFGGAPLVLSLYCEIKISPKHQNLNRKGTCCSEQSGTVCKINEVSSHCST